MAKLYKIASFCFDISLYLWIYVSYIAHEGPLPIILALIFFTSLFLLAFLVAIIEGATKLALKELKF